MILIMSGDQFTLDTGAYYSPPFKQDTVDILVTVVVKLTESGTYSMQESIDEVTWVDVPDSTVTCNTTGLQTFTDCHYDLSYRIKASKEVTEAKILV